METEDYTCRSCGVGMFVPDGMEPLEKNVRYCVSCMSDVVERLRAQVMRYKKAADERLCESCLESHPVDTLCPPHEVRTTGQQWFRDRLKEKQDEIEQLLAEKEFLRQQVKKLVACKNNADEQFDRLAAFTAVGVINAPKSDCTLVERIIAEVTQLRQRVKKPSVGDAYTSLFQSDLDERGMPKELLQIQEVEYKCDDDTTWSIWASDDVGYDCCWSERHQVWCYNLG